MFKVFLIFNFISLSLSLSCLTYSGNYGNYDLTSKLVSVDCNKYYGATTSYSYKCGTALMTVISKKDNSIIAYLKYAMHCIIQNSCNQTIYSNSSEPKDSLYIFKNQYLCCDTNDCNTQSEVCFSTQFFSDLKKLNLTSVNLVNISGLIVKNSCDNSESSEILVSLNVGLKVALEFKSSYWNLSSQESINFINDFKSFISGALSGNIPIEIKVISLSPGSVIVSSVLNFQSNQVPNVKNFSSQIQTSINNAANSSKIFPVVTDSISVSLISSNGNKLNLRAFSHLTAFITFSYFLAFYF